MNKLVSVALLRLSASVFTKIRERKHTFPSRKPYGNIEKMVRFRRNRSHGNMNKRHESATGNTCYPLCFRNVVTCFRKISVCGILAFRPVFSSKQQQPAEVLHLKRESDEKSVYLQVLEILHILCFTDVNSETEIHFFLVKFMNSTSENMNQKRQVFEFLIQGALRRINFT